MRGTTARDDSGGVVQLASRSSLDLAPPPPYRPDMDRRRLLLTSLAGAFAAPLAVEAQPASKVYRIGFLGAALLRGMPRTSRRSASGFKTTATSKARTLRWSSGGLKASTIGFPRSRPN
jgi:hypothetical protein